MAQGVFLYRAKPGVYKMTNLVNGNFFIGSSKNISQRIKTHKAAFKKGYRYNIRIREDLLKYGKESFSFEVLEYCDESIMKDREQYFFELLKPTYNIWPTIYNAAGRSYTDEQKQIIFKYHPIKDKESFRKKLKEAWKLRRERPDGIATLKMLDRTGKLHSEETKKLYSLQRKGKPKSEETKKKMSEARLGWKYINGQWIKKLGDIGGLQGN